MTESRRDVRWGILATGNIANSMAMALQSVEDAQVVAVGSRSETAANAFGDAWGIPNRYGSYDGLLSDPSVDIVYISTPHALHYDNVLDCLEAGKHVLCEKPLTLDAVQARRCVSVAREKGLFLMEAMWMRFIPAIVELKKLLDDKVLGSLQFAEINFSFHGPLDPNSRLFNPKLGGGALLDIGIYSLSFARMMFGEPRKVCGKAHLTQEGVDQFHAVNLEYDDNFWVNFTSSIRYTKPREAFIIGEKGYLRVHEPFFFTKQLSLHLEGHPVKQLSFPYDGNGYNHEVYEVHRCLREQRIESSVIPHGETIALLEVMDRLRDDWGVRY